MKVPMMRYRWRNIDADGEIPRSIEQQMHCVSFRPETETIICFWWFSHKSLQQVFGFDIYLFQIADIQLFFVVCTKTSWTTSPQNLRQPFTFERFRLTTLKQPLFFGGFTPTRTAKPLFFFVTFAQTLKAHHWFQRFLPSNMESRWVLFLKGFDGWHLGCIWRRPAYHGCLSPATYTRNPWEASNDEYHWNP